jgi:hypothetical protein
MQTGWQKRAVYMVRADVKVSYRGHINARILNFHIFCNPDINFLAKCTILYKKSYGDFTCH